MSKKSEFKGLIQVSDSGDIKWFNTDKIRDFLKGHNGERFEFVIKKYRTPRQNKYYWVLIGILADHLGYTNDEMHEIAQYQFLQEEYVNGKTGTIMKRIKSTKELSKYEMMNYIDSFKRWASIEFSVVLPDPLEQQKMEYEQ